LRKLHVEVNLPQSVNLAPIQGLQVIPILRRAEVR